MTEIKKKIAAKKKSKKKVVRKKRKAIARALAPVKKERVYALGRLRENRARALTDAGIKQMREAFRTGSSLAQVATVLGLSTQQLRAMRDNDDPLYADWKIEFEMGETEARAWWDRAGTEGMITDAINPALYKFKMASMFGEHGRPDVELNIHNEAPGAEPRRMVDESATTEFVASLETAINAIDAEFTEVVD